jgi:hypothetical protein
MAREFLTDGCEFAEIRFLIGCFAIARNYRALSLNCKTRRAKTSSRMLQSHSCGKMPTTRGIHTS